MKVRLVICAIVTILGWVLAYAMPDRAAGFSSCLVIVIVFLMTEVAHQWRLRGLQTERAEMWKRIAEERGAIVRQTVAECERHRRPPPMPPGPRRLDVN